MFLVLINLLAVVISIFGINLQLLTQVVARPKPKYYVDKLTGEVSLCK